MSDPKLTKVEEKVLIELYHAGERGEKPTATIIAKAVKLSEDIVETALARLLEVGFVGEAR